MPQFNKIKLLSSSRALLLHPQLYCQDTMGKKKDAMRDTGDSEAKDMASILKKFAT